MNIACSSCPAKYAVPDEKVRGRKVRITCKRCGAAIIVDGTDVGAASTEEPKPEAPKPEAVERPKQRTMLGGLQAAPQPAAPADPAPAAKGIALPKPGGAKVGATGAAAFPSPAKAAAATAPKAAVATPAAKATAAPAAATKAPVEKPWTVAVTDDDHRDMVTSQVVELYAAHTIDAETFIWRDGMEDWLTPFEIPDIAAALKARGLEARTNDAVDAPAAVDSTADARQSGSWREPGKWKDGDGQKKPDATFDDVTVAMTAPKAQALLDAAISAEEANASKATEAVREAKPEAETAPPPMDTATPLTADALGLGSDGPFRLPFEEPAEADGGVVSSTAAPVRAAVNPRRAERAREDAPDLFATAAAEEPGPRSRMPSVPPEAGQTALTGARNESSVLFSLDQLAGKPKAKSAPKRNDKADAEALLLGNSSDDAAPPSVANLGGGALFGAAAMAAPDFMAPTAASAPIHSRPSSGPPPKAAAPKSSRTGLFLGLGALVLVGGGAAFVMLKPAPEPPAPAVTTQVATPTPPATATEPVQPAPSASATAEAASAAPSAGAPPTAPVESGAAPTAATPAPTAAPAAAKTQSPAAATNAPTPKPATPTPAAAAAPVAPQAAAEGPAFDKDAASAALSTAAATAEGQCASQDGNHGVGKVTITFTNSGRATNALVSGDFAGSALGGCVARVFRSAHVPAFSGDVVRVTKTVRIP